MRCATSASTFSASSPDSTPNQSRAIWGNARTSSAPTSPGTSGAGDPAEPTCTSIGLSCESGPSTSSSAARHSSVPAERACCGTSIDSRLTCSRSSSAVSRAATTPPPLVTSTTSSRSTCASRRRYSYSGSSPSCATVAAYSSTGASRRRASASSAVSSSATIDQPARHGVGQLKLRHEILDEPELPVGVELEEHDPVLGRDDQIDRAVLEPVLAHERAAAVGDLVGKFGRAKTRAVVVATEVDAVGRFDLGCEDIVADHG